MPDFVVRWAAVQRFQARQISKAYAQPPDKGDVESNANARHAGEVRPEPIVAGSAAAESNVNANLAEGNVMSKTGGSAEPQSKLPWTNVHSFFLIMGGFATDEDKSRSTIYFEDLKNEPRTAWPSVKEDEINDKSNSDAFAKMFVVGQTTWFVVQLVARVVEGLAITELEIMTLAYSVLCPLLYGLWWDKPYDVQTPIIVPALGQPQSGSHHSSPVDPTSNHAQPNNPPTNKSRPNPSSLAFPSLATLCRNIFEGSEYDFSDNSDFRIQVTVLFIASATIFGCIHCIPWNFPFPTTLERKVWTYSAFIIATTPPMCGFVVALKEYNKIGGHNDKADDDKVDDDKADDDPKVIMTMLQIIHAIINCTYFLARVILIVQAFVLLRDLSPSAAQSITWSRLIPHI